MQNPHGTASTVLNTEQPYALAAASCLNSLEAGDKITIIHGPLQGLTGIILSLDGEECLAELLQLQGVCARLSVTAIAPAG